MIDIIIMVIIGGVAGMLAGILIKGKGLGILMNVVLGICGAVLAGWLSKYLGLAFQGNIGYFISAFAGSVLILFIIRQFNK